LPAPTGVTVGATSNRILISWGFPTGAESAIAYTEVWAQGPGDWGEALPAADPGLAQLVGSSPYTQLGISTESNRTWRFFVRFRGLADQVGPWHDVSGTIVTSGLLASDVLNEVEGQLAEIHLVSSLAGRIDLIDASETGILDRLELTEADLYDPATGVIALNESLTEIVTDPDTGLSTRASQTDFDSLSTAVTDPETGLGARTLQSNYTTMTSAIGVDPETGAFTADGFAETMETLETAVNDPTTGLTAKAGSTEFTNLQTWIGVDDAGNPTAGGTAEDLDQLFFELADPASDTSSFGMITQISTIQGDLDDIQAEWGVQIVTGDPGGAIMSGISLLNGTDSSTFQVLADKVAFWDPGPGYIDVNGNVVDSNDKTLIFGYDQITYDWDQNNTPYAKTVTVLRETFIESATMDFATINHNLTAGSIIVTGDDDNPDFEGAAIKTPSIDGGVIRGTRLEIGGGSSGYGNMSDIPGSLSDINGTEGTKLSGIEEGATLGSIWAEVQEKPVDLTGLGNLIQPFNAWVAGTSGPTQDAGDGPAYSYNYVAAVYGATYLIAPDEGPMGFEEEIWRCFRASDGTEGDGGFITDSFPVSNGRTYLKGFYVRLLNPTPFVHFHGSHNGGVENLSGTAMGQILVSQQNIPDDGEWYLVLFLIHPAGFTGQSTGVSGVYRVSSAEKIISADDFRWSPTATTSLHGAITAGNNSGVADEITAEFARPFVLLASRVPDIQYLTRKLVTIETDATVGAQWPTNDGSGGNINGFPTHLIDDPTDGLNATGTAFGYYDAANTIWKTLLDNQGNAYFRGQVLVDSNPGGARVQIKETLITVFDENNVARVKIGNLA
jgi:hypothetical protein